MLNPHQEYLAQPKKTANSLHPILFDGYEDQETAKQTDLFTKNEFKHATGINESLEITTTNLVEIYEKVPALDSGVQLLKLFLGREEKKLKLSNPLYPEYTNLWNNARRRRTVTPQEILGLTSTSKFIKELFNCYFRDEVYGKLYSRDNIIMSGGSSSEETFGIPQVLKECLTFALHKNWYGYSSSLGRESVRDAVARLESKLLKTEILPERVAITMGATSTFASLFDFISLHKQCKNKKSLCVIPNYPPIIEAANQRLDIELVPCDYGSERNLLTNLLARIKHDTPVITLQTAINPSGKRICETEIEKLIKTANPNTVIILDECHEILHTQNPTTVSPLRNNHNVVRVKSLSKDFSSPGLKIGWFISSKEFISNYYEYASTNYGSCPSIFYLLTEVLARFERYFQEKVTELNTTNLREFDKNYHLSLANLNAAYAQYVHYRTRREHTIISKRIEITDRLMAHGIKAIRADHSVNIACLNNNYNSSYALYRDILHHSNLSVYPGILAFDFSNPVFRLSPFIGDSMHAGINQLISFSTNHE